MNLTISVGHCFRPESRYAYGAKKYHGANNALHGAKFNEDMCKHLKK
jgi:hypothetical protein